MLKTITDYIQSIPDISFSKYYVDYIIKMQDIGIESEMYSVSKISDLRPIDFETNIYKDLSELIHSENKKSNQS